MSRRALAPDLLAGLVLAAVCIVMAQSLGALIFSGPLAAAAHLGTSAALLTACVSGLLIARAACAPGTIATPQERIAPLLVLIAQSITTRLPDDTRPESIAMTVLAALATTSLITGIVLFTLGRWRLGSLTRYLPYPVMGGFLAGSGWLLVIGAVRVSTGAPLQAWSSLDGPRLSLVLAQVAAALTQGLLLFTFIRLRPKPILFTALLIGSVPLFFLLLAGFGIPIATARDQGWLPSAHLAGGLSLNPWTLDALRLVEWDLLPGIAPVVGSVLVTSALSILFNSSGVELLTRTELDLNRELRIAGVSNVANAFGFGLVGFQSLNLTRLGWDLGSRDRRAPTLAAALCGLAWLAGPTPATFFPRFVLGGILCCLGLGFLHDWVLRARHRLPRGDYAVVLVILAVIGTLGYVQGVAVGLLAALVLFVLNYSKVSVVTHALTASDHPSNVDRPPEHRNALAELGPQVLVLRLQGYLFFGTASSLLRQIRHRAENSSAPPLRFVALDFQRVSGLDSSAVFSLTRALQLAEKHRFQIVFTQLSPRLRQQLAVDVLKQDSGPQHRILPTLDHGIEWCEESLLSATPANQSEACRPPRHVLEPYWPNPAALTPFIEHLERLVIPAGTCFIAQHSAPDALYFIESGRVTTALATPSGLNRIRRQGPGTVVGELGLILGVPRTASVIADTDLVVHRLSTGDLERMKREQPELAAQFFEFLAHLLAERVVHSNRIIRAFME